MKISTTIWEESQPTVLLVDDDISMGIMGDAVLQSAGFKFRHVSSGREALDLIDEVKPDIVLLDIVMPEMDGFRVCEKIKELQQYRDTPVIMLTGNDDSESVKEAYSKGAWDFTSKPINWPILVNRCWHALEASAAMIEARDAARLASILDNSYNEICHINATNFEIREVNEGFSKRQEESDTLVGKPVYDYIVGYDYDMFKGLIQPLEAGEPQVSFTAELRQGDGSTCPFEGLILSTIDSANDPVYVAIFQDISERQRKEREVYNLQFFDIVTGLPNRLLISQRIEQALVDAHHNFEKCALILIDLDGFKLVNDALGHRIGDEVLKVVAMRLKNTMERYSRSAEGGANVQLARLGGDEFVFLVSGMEDLTVTKLIAEELLEKFVRPIELNDHEITLTGSMGISIYPYDADNVDDLMKNADVAMYTAKSSGKNSFRFYSQADNDMSLEILTTESRLRRAIENNELLLNYQLQVDNKSREVCGIEALVRWNHPEKGMVSPGLFIPIAEETSLIIDIGNWVIARVLEDSRTWLKGLLKPEVEIGINVSARQLQHPDFLNTLKAHWEKTEPAHQIVLEITESSIMTDTKKQIALLQELRKIGFQIAIDDFGTGYSSLSYLKDLPVDCLKIDQSFVRNIETSEMDLAIAKIIFNLAQMLNLKVVAEGVETAAQAGLLADCGDYLIQGYLISRPLPQQDFIEFVNTSCKT